MYSNPNPCHRKQFFIYSAVGFVLWMVIATIIPVPWPSIIMFGVLGGSLKYCSSSWGHSTTVAYRREKFRDTKLSSVTWSWSLIAAVLIVVALLAILGITLRLITFPADAWALGLNYLNFAQSNGNMLLGE
ncbi:MAG: hypothetical protein PVF74_12850 [Anaerolineales bacterium]|jgi:hypothetical protein